MLFIKVQNNHIRFNSKLMTTGNNLSAAWHYYLQCCHLANASKATEHSHTNALSHPQSPGDAVLCYIDRCLHSEGGAAVSVTFTRWCSILTQTLTQCRIKVGPPSTTLALHKDYFGSITQQLKHVFVCWRSSCRFLRKYLTWQVV